MELYPHMLHENTPNEKMIDGIEKEFLVLTRNLYKLVKQIVNHECMVLVLLKKPALLFLAVQGWGNTTQWLSCGFNNRHFEANVSQAIGCSRFGRPFIDTTM